MQQVNLYLEEFQETEPKFSAFLTVVLAGILMGFCLLISAAIGGIYFYEKSLLSDVRKDLAQWQQELEVAQKQYPAPLVDARLTQKIEALQANKQRNLKLLNYLSSHNMDVKTQSFSKVLSGLTEVKQEGLWLTEIKLQQGGALLSLQGRTLNADAVPEYLKKLSKLAVFKNMNFKVFDMNRQDGDLVFVISSQREQQDARDLLEQVTTRLQ